jgi:hypothetical protein
MLWRAVGWQFVESNLIQSVVLFALPGRVLSELDRVRAWQCHDVIMAIREIVSLLLTLLDLHGLTIDLI